MSEAAAIRVEAAEVLARADSLSGSIFVFGNPVILLGVGREAVLPIHGWSPEFYDDVTWERWTGDFKRDPPAYVFIDQSSLGIVTSRALVLWSWLESQYEVVETLFSGMIVLELVGV